MTKFKVGDRVVQNKNDIVAEWVDEPVVAHAPAKPKFKVGDEVRRHYSTTSGIIERVDAASYHINYGSYWGYRDFSENELVLVSSAKATNSVKVTNLAIVCLIENGQPKPSINPFVHTSSEAAATEAKRLAGKYRGKKFGVYVLSSTEEQAAPSYSHEWQRLTAKGEKINAIKELRTLTGMQLKPAKDVVEHFVDYPYGAAA